ncbi:MAG: SMC-Scp complex subunit ScpB, partial [Proteobacteria bacterium]
MADSKDKNLEENDVGSGADSVSSAPDSELSAEELAAIERWQLMASGEDFVLEPQVPVVKKKSGKKVKGASVVDSPAAVDDVSDSPLADRDESVSLSAVDDVSPSADVDEGILLSADDEQVSPSVNDIVSEDETIIEEVNSRKSNNREAKTKKTKNRKTTTKPNPQEQKADNGIGDQFTEDSEEKEKEQDELEEPGEEDLQLIPHPGKDLTLSQENQDDRQGLMRWDEAITLEAQVECIIFATPKPISVSEIAELLADDDGIEPSHASIETHAQQLQRLYKERNGGFRLEYDKGAGYQFRTVPAAAPLMERMFSSRQRPLSRAAHETLAIIAYRQPCTRADIEFIRGVDA